MNQLDARLQVYEATPEYAKNNPKFSVDNFTGFFYQIHLTGKVDKVYGIEQGKFTHRIQLKPKEKSRIGKIQTRGWCDGCFYDDPTAGIATKIRCWLCDAFAISNGGDSGIDPITSTNPFGLLGYGETPTIDIGYGENTSVGSTGSSNPLGTGGNSLGTEFDDSIFNDPAYQQKIKEDYVLLTLNPTGTEREFLANNRALFDQFYSFLLQQGDYLEKISTSKQHLKLLMENTAYLSANQQVAYTSTIIETLSKYTKAGFMAEEFADLYIDKVAFQEVNVFLNKYQFQGTSVRDIKSILPYLRNTSTHDAALNIIKKDEIIRFGSGDSDFYITDVEKELKCFTRSTNGEKLFKVSICSDQPISNSRETRSGSDAGHTFLILEETDKITGEIVRRTLGFYPDDWMSAALQKERPSQLGRNAPHPYDVSISSDLKESDFFGVINNVRILSKNKYDLGKFNCTTFAIDCVQNYGFDNLPRTQVQITSTHGNGLTPSNLAEDMRAIILKPWQTRETTTNTPMPNSGSCN